MERFVSIFGGITRNGPLNSREMLEPIQSNHQKALIPPSYHNSIFNPLLPNTLCFGFGSNAQVNPSVPFFISNENENSNLGNSQWSNDLNRITEGSTETRQAVYQRMRWTDEMVKTLITAVSYIEEDALFYSLTTEKGDLLVPPIKGKWRAISSTMIEKGHLVSPQQCEDKFNDLNKRYKRLNEILGKGTAYEIVMNPSLVDVLSINEEAKDEVTKLLSCKQLFFREMCSFHNKNRKYLPHDEGLKQIVQYALRGKVKYMSQDVGVPPKRQKQGEGTGVYGNFMLTNGSCELTNFTHGAVEGVRNLDQRMKSRQLEENRARELTNFTHGAAEGVRNLDQRMKSQQLEENGSRELTNFTHGAVEGVRNLDQWMKSRSVQLEEKALLIKNQMLELEKSKLEWMKLCEKEDMELNKMRLDNELMKFENKRLAYEIECQKKSYHSKS